jgi:REP element-mobilizing transposase RayT
MTRSRKLSHSIWRCQYHFVWAPKYRLRIVEAEEGLEGALFSYANILIEIRALSA